MSSYPWAILCAPRGCIPTTQHAQRMDDLAFSTQIVGPGGVVTDTGARKHLKYASHRRLRAQALFERRHSMIHVTSCASPPARRETRRGETFQSSRTFHNLCLIAVFVWSLRANRRWSSGIRVKPETAKGGRNPFGRMRYESFEFYAPA